MNPSLNRAAFLQTFSFWEAVRRDPLMGGSLLLAGVLVLTQAGFISMAFWSRAHFGRRFDDKIFSDYQRVQSTKSVNDNLKLEEAERARARARVVVHDEVSVMLERADQEMNLERARDKETQIVNRQLEKQSQNALQMAENAWNGGKREEALKILQNGLQMASDDLSLNRTLAMKLEEHGDLTQSRFQWEKVQGIALPDSPEMKEAHERLEKLSKEGSTAPVAMGNGGDKIVNVHPASLPKTLKILEVKQTDLTLQENDLRFNLRFILEAGGNERSIEIAKTGLEVVFYDQSPSAAGMMVPIKILASTLQPRQTWPVGGQQALSLNYTAPKGYFQRKTGLLGQGYQFCGFIARLYYKDQLQDEYASTPMLRALCSPLDAQTHP